MKKWMRMLLLPLMMTPTRRCSRLMTRMLARVKFLTV